MPTAAPSSPRLPVVAVALGLALLVAALGGTSFQRQIDSFQPLGFESQADQGGWRVTRVEDEGTGLKPDDEVLLVRGDTVASQLELRERLRAEPEAELLVQRGDGLVTVAYERPELAVDVAYLLLAVIGVVYLLIGLYTILKDGRAPAVIFFFWCLLSAALYILSPIAAPQDMTDEVIFLVDQVARNLLPPLTLHLFLVFPAPLFRALERPARRRLALAGLYLPSALLLAFHADQVFAGGKLFKPSSIDTALFLVDRLELNLLVAFVLLAGLALFVRAARRPRWEERRQVQWVAAGLAGGYVPFFLVYVVPWSMGLHWRFTEVAGVIPLALVPLGFAYAILKYKLWDIGILLRDTAAYTLTLLVGIFGFAVIHLAIRRGVTADMEVARNFLTFAAGLAVAGVLVPTRHAISSGLERWQYRKTLPHRRALGRLGEELLYERDLAKLCTTLIDRLTEGLAAHANLYLARANGRLAPVVPDAELDAELDPKAFGDELWSRDVKSLRPIGLPDEEASVEERLFAAGYRYAFPLLVRDHRVGILLVSYKFDGEPLNSEDLELTRGLLNQASLAIENAHLLAEVHHRLEEVERLEEHNKGIIEASPVGIAVLDKGERVVLANHAFAEVVGQDDVAGKALVELLPISPLPEPGDGLVEVSFGELSGRERYLQVSVAAFEGEDGKPLRIFSVQDTSQLHAMELALKEKERLAALGLLAAGVAHEVNTPLTGISSYAQLLMADFDAADPHYEILKKLERQSFRAAQIVNNLLEFSRNRQDELQPVHLPGVIAECLHMLDERLAETGVEVDWQRPSAEVEKALLVLGNEGELHQVANNLMVNALDAMGTGGRLTITLETTAERIVVRFADTGPGIPSERLGRIFQPFFSSKVGKGGTGLGLAITYNIVRRHRGLIRAENRDDGQGAVFTVELPRHETR